MARLSPASAIGAWNESRDQLAAVARLRWCIFLNSARTVRGRLEAVSWGLMGIAFAVIGIGGMLGFGVAAFYFVSRGETEWLALFLWITFLYWQLFPVMATAFAESFDSANFLRFPLRYRTYFFIRLAYGAFDPATVVALEWVIGLFAGIAIASPVLLPWAALVLAAFAAFNLLLNRAIFAWIERWLARRRTREILGIVFFLLIISFQFLGPLTARFGHHKNASFASYASSALRIERALPPGLAGEALARATNRSFASALGAFAMLCIYATACLWILDLRLRAQFHGETISEAAGPSVTRDQAKSAGPAEQARVGWNLPGISSPIAAVFEKEFRYLSRSSPMLFTLVMPIVVLFIIRLDRAAIHAGRNAHPPSSVHPVAVAFGQYAFPIGVAYALLILTNLMYNCLGADGGGVQMYFVAPVRFRDVILGKNLVHAAVIVLETLIIWIASLFMFGPAPLGIVLITLSALLFAAAVNFAVGDCLSLLSPKKIDFGMFGRQRAAGTTVLAGFVAQAIVFGLVALAFALARYFGKFWVALVMNLAFAALAIAAYAILLNRIDGFARHRREAIISELLRA
jgi:ABC-2 type transport system permease protein